jgi:hypothetical protein
MKSTKPSYGTTLAAIKSKSEISAVSAFTIIPLVVLFSLLGWHQFRIAGYIGGSLLGFIVGVTIEMHLIARRFGITRRMMLVCKDLKVRGDVETLCNRVLVAFAIIRKGGLVAQPRAVDKFFDDLLKGLNALGLFPPHQRYATYEGIFKKLVDKLECIIDSSEQGTRDVTESLSALHQEARSFCESVIKEVRRLVRAESTLK